MRDGDLLSVGEEKGREKEKDRSRRNTHFVVGCGHAVDRRRMFFDGFVYVRQCLMTVLHLQDS